MSRVARLEAMESRVMPPPGIAEIDFVYGCGCGGKMRFDHKEKLENNECQRHETKLTRIDVAHFFLR